jgi:AcrR family transcriptional regulator
MLRAVPAAVRAKGFSALTVEDVCARAKVSRRTFYENFRDKQDCFITSYHQHAQELLTVVGGAPPLKGRWEERVRLGMVALLRYLAERDDVAHMAVIEVMAAGPVALDERDRAIAALAALLREGSPDLLPTQVRELRLRTVSGAILHLIYATVLAGRSAELERLLPSIMYLVLVALHGPTEAASQAGLIPSRAE